MSQSGTHYERAFESFLQRNGLPYVAIDQARKAVFAGVALKSFDFIVYPRKGRKMLVDVKGRKLSWPTYSNGRLGQSWTTTDDIDSMQDWEQVFGCDHQAVFVFAYWLYDKAPPTPPTERISNIYYFQQRSYHFLVADLHAYKLTMKPRSPKWNTVYVPAKPFKSITQPFETFINIRAKTRH